MDAVPVSFPNSPEKNLGRTKKKTCRLPGASLIEVFIAWAAAISPARQIVDMFTRLDVCTVCGRKDPVSAPDNNDPEA